MKFSELAAAYNKKFGFNVLPAQGKRPTIAWENWQLIEQTEKDVIALGWNPGITGIGGICGINDIGNLDFDKVSDSGIVEMFAKRLGLGEIYPWIVKSGSGIGFHIWFKSSENNEFHRRLNGPKSIYRMNLKDSDVCDHIELRWCNSMTVLPYSKHPSGNVYTFMYGKPEEAPKEISAEVLLECLEEFCDLKREKEILAVGKKTFEPAGFDKEKLESAIEFLAAKLPGNCYDEWYRIGF